MDVGEEEKKKETKMNLKKLRNENNMYFFFHLTKTKLKKHDLMRSEMLNLVFTRTRGGVLSPVHGSILKVAFSISVQKHPTGFISSLFSVSSLLYHSFHIIGPPPREFFNPVRGDYPDTNNRIIE